MMENRNATGYRPTWAQIDLDNLSHNLRQIRNNIAPGVRIMACVKAEAYGHGLIPVSRQLVNSGVEFLAVASIDEAVALRSSGIACRILVLGLVLEQDVPALFEYDISPTVCSMALALGLDRHARRTGRAIDVHIKIDTGMARIGIMHDKAYDFVRKVSAFPGIRIEGIFTHLACADTDKLLTLSQISLFDSLVRRLKKNGAAIPLVHAANSMGVASYKNSHFSMVRPGLILYGLRPADDISLDLKPVMSLKTKVIFVKNVKAGTGISYGHTYKTTRATRIATLPIGYGDGYPRNLSNTGPVLINGKRFTIAGRVCMDQVMVDMGREQVKVGDEAVLIGSQAKERISAESLASLAATIPYEIVCGIGSRVPRVYTKKTALPQDKRRRERAVCRIPVRFVDTPSLSGTPGIAADISSGGLKLFTADPVLPYRPYELSLEQRRAEPVRVTASAVWSRPAPGNRHVCGMKFEKELRDFKEVF